ncbi:response regulator transcription factor [Veillonella atypica]|uniref:response regulator transcription factor n=1 Tax=Veillonella atypica TaxID=39777 RepID=UPI001961B79E|nr:response regulator transcription factor [Veillonella atypica]VTY44760.1 Transcriptional regulatory protein SrrA [Veillonella atypica]
MKKILIIEDDKGISELERDYLEIEGFEVEIATDGVTGIEKAIQNDYSCIILDIMLPKKDGFSICKDIRMKKEVPILMVSAKREDIDKIRGLGIGADDYLTKPFSPAELVARVKSHIQRFERILASTASPAKVEEPKITAGHLEINLASRMVLLHDEVVPLTPREYEILVLLAMHPSRVFTKEEIYERLWEADSFGETSTVMVHVNRLRIKVDKKYNGEQYIDTVWGVGYRFHQWENYKIIK